MKPDSVPRITFTSFFLGYPSITFEEGAIIHSPGELPRNIYYVETGFVKLYALSAEGGEKLLVMLKPGEVFSLTAALLNKPTNFYAESLKSSVLRAVPRDEFVAFARSDVIVMEMLMAVLLKTITVLNNRVYTLSLTRAYDRLLSRLAFLAEVFGVKQSDGSIVINVPLTHQDLGSSINLSRESTSKAMRRLQNEGIVKYKNGSIIVLKPKHLAEPIS